jgi:hypothetical protein
MGVIMGYSNGSFDPDGEIARAEFAIMSARFAHIMGIARQYDRSFSDIGGHWAEDEILYAVGVGWGVGYPDGTFRPDRPISRAEFITIVNRMLGREPEAADAPPGDWNVTWADNADPDAWYYWAVQEATNSRSLKKRG